MADDHHPGGLITGAASADNVPVLLRPGEHVYGPGGRLVLVIKAGDEHG